ncbi:MAG TPA: UDP-N-acetylmuramoyl-L-alanine--D-glutamate ligase [Acidimicrobiales bacterium]
MTDPGGSPDPEPRPGVLVVGLAVTGEAVARRLTRDGTRVVAVDDHPDEAVRKRAASLDIALVEAPSAETITELAADAALVVVSPGVPADHPVFGLGDRAHVVSEVELAAGWARAPLVAVTGTNGKTTVTTLVSRMLVESGVRAVTAGNIGVPLAEAVDGDAEVLVVEVSSFQLAFTERFRPRVAVWLNVAENHLDWHPSVAHYVQSKSRVWANQRDGDVAVANAEDPAVMAAAASAPVPVITFGRAEGSYRIEGGDLVSPTGERIVGTEELPRSFPHDLVNGLAACAGALAAGATLDGCRAALRTFAGLPHRLQLVGESGGVRYLDDSKATTPAAVLAALSGLDSVVLIAGGRNKGLRLDSLRDGAERVRAVVAIGEAVPEVEAAFAGASPVLKATSMDEAVRLASELARPGDSVLLSPGCASFDWYRSYGQRGDDFARAVRIHAGDAG